jgi:hypothetical protein
VNERGKEYDEERMPCVLQAVPGESASETVRHLLQDLDGASTTM